MLVYKKKRNYFEMVSYSCLAYVGFRFEEIHIWLHLPIWGNSFNFSYINKSFDVPEIQCNLKFIKDLKYKLIIYERPKSLKHILVYIYIYIYEKLMFETWQ